jgi:NifU-like protein involved in Fe-S cluster formation
MPRFSASLLDHVRAPRNGGAMESPDVVGKAGFDGRPPYVVIYLRASDGIVRRAMFQTYGCAVSIACCSVLTEMIAGSSLSECSVLTGASILESLSGVPYEKQFCANMAVEALQDAIAQLSAATPAPPDREANL